MRARDGAVTISACPSSEPVRQVDARGRVPLHALRPRISGEDSHASCSP